MKNQFNLKQLLVIVVFTVAGINNSTVAQVKDAVSEGKYIIKCAKDKNMVLDGTNIEKGGSVILKKRDTARKGQVWRVTKVGGIFGGYVIKCADNSLVLDGDGVAVAASLASNATSGGIRLQLWDRNSGGIRTNQEWYVGKADGNKTIFNVMNDKKYVDAKDDASNGSKVLLFNRNSSSHDLTQQWVFEKVD